MSWYLIVGVVFCLSACESQSTQPENNVDMETPDLSMDAGLDQSGSAISVSADVWVDNWFALYVNGAQVAEDSVSITTERSFNKESFAFKTRYPFVLAFVAKDFKQNDTGLEYIGQPNQQIGDGGLIAQFKDEATGQVIAVTDAGWKCKVIHTAPLDRSCASQSNPQAGVVPCTFESIEAPEGWTSLSFDDSAWANASTFTSGDVRPKDGYNEVTWDSQARFIWSADLDLHNTVLCRQTVNQP